MWADDPSLLLHLMICRYELTHLPLYTYKYLHFTHINIDFHLHGLLLFCRCVVGCWRVVSPPPLRLFTSPAQERTKSKMASSPSWSIPPAPPTPPPTAATTTTDEEENADNSTIIKKSKIIPLPLSSSLSTSSSSPYPISCPLSSLPDIVSATISSFLSNSGLLALRRTSAPVLKVYGGNLTDVLLY